MKNKKLSFVIWLILLLFIIFSLLFENVFAAAYDTNGNFLPVYATIDNTTIVAIEQPTNRSVVKTTTSNQKYFDITFIVNYDLPEDITDNPYVVVLFKSFTTDLKITRQSTCNNECFSSTYQLYTLGRTIWQPQGFDSYLMALVLPISKYNYDQNMNLYQVSDILRFTYTGEEPYLNYEFFNVYGTNTLTGIDTGYQNTIDTINKIDELKNTLNSALSNMSNSTTQVMESMRQALIDESGVPNNDVSSKTSEWSNKLAGTGPVSNMVLMPITLLNGYITGFNSVCTPYNLGNLMGTDIILPCINISNYVGSDLWNVIDILFSGFMIYAIGKKFVKIFNDFTNLRDNQMDELYGGGK